MKIKNPKRFVIVNRRLKRGHMLSKLKFVEKCIWRKGLGAPRSDVMLSGLCRLADFFVMGHYLNLMVTTCVQRYF